MSAASIPTISVIIPARNEEVYLPKCITALQESAKQADIPIEIVVVLNRCTDRTEEIAKSAGCTIVSEDAKNLSLIRNAGVRAARAEWLVTVDADSAVSPGMIGAIARALADPTAVGGGTLILPERYSLGILLTGIILLPFIVFERLSGGLFWFRRADFEAIGGFDPKLVSVEDIDFARRLKRHGMRPPSGTPKRRFKAIWREHIVTSCRKFDVLGDWFFILHPFKLWKIFRGRDQSIADRVWYDFRR